MIVNSKNIPNFAAANRKISCAESEISTQLNAIGVWCSWLAFLHGVQAVARSSRATPTKEQLSFLLLFLFYHLDCFVPRNDAKRQKKDTLADVLFVWKLRQNQYSHKLCSKSNILFLMRSDS